MPLYKFRPAPADAPSVKGFLDVEHQNIQRAIHGITARTVTVDTKVFESDYLILANPASGPIDITFPLANKAKDRDLTLKQIVSNANPVTLIGTFDGVVDPTIGGINKALTVQSDGLAWYVTGKVV